MYVDADWGGCQDTRRSTTGYIAFLHGSPISWSSKRQQTTAVSSMESEYIAGAEATKDVVWLRALLAELGVTISGPTTLYIDNQAAISLANNPSDHSKSKHIHIKHHFLREQVHFGSIVVEYIKSENQRADGLTKPLSGPVHSKWIRSVCVG